MRRIDGLVCSRKPGSMGGQRCGCRPDGNARVRGEQGPPLPAGPSCCWLSASTTLLTATPSPSWIAMVQRTGEMRSCKQGGNSGAVLHCCLARIKCHHARQAKPAGTESAVGSARRHLQELPLQAHLKSQLAASLGQLQSPAVVSCETAAAALIAVVPAAGAQPEEARHRYAWLVLLLSSRSQLPPRSANTAAPAPLASCGRRDAAAAAAAATAIPCPRAAGAAARLSIWLAR